MTTTATICKRCEWEQEKCQCLDFGPTTVLPWTLRGHKFDIKVGNSNWKQVWPEIDNDHLDPVQAAADFYLLESISANALHNIKGLSVSPLMELPAPTDMSEADKRFFHLYGIKKNQQADYLALRSEKVSTDPDAVTTLRLVMGDATKLLEERVVVIDKTLTAYAAMAISGELRHHTAFALTGDRTKAWCLWRQIQDEVGNDALQDAARMFYEFTKSGYGGPKWANCAEILWARLEGKLGPDGPDGIINKRMFIDRFWTLEHNNGCFLNKINWACNNPLAWGVQQMKKVLDAHASNPPKVKTLVQVASEPTRNIYRRYLEAVNVIAEQKGITPFDTSVLKAVQVTRYCKGCFADIAMGHYPNCKVMQNKSMYEFNGPDENGEFTGGGKLVKSWWTPAIAGNVDSSVMAKYEQSQEHPELLGYKADGTYIVDKDMPVTLNAYFSWMTKGSHKSNSHVVKGTFAEFAEGKLNFTPDAFGCKSKVSEFSYEVTFSNQDTGKQIAYKSDYGHKYSGHAVDTFHTDPFDLATILKSSIGTWEYK
jgi:hypothetical protein